MDRWYNRSMSLTLDLTCLVAGGPQGAVGVDPADLQAAESAHAAHRKSLLDKRAGGELGFFDLPDQQIDAIRAFADKQHGRFENIVVLGIGGSALGTQALHAALSPALHDRRPRDISRPKLFVIDNVDPVLVGGILRAANPATTLYNVISKSGSTAETMSQFLLVLEALKHTVGDHWQQHVVVTTDGEAGFLRPFAEANGLTTFAVPGNVGGRFSVLSPVGLVPGALMGWELDELLEGAAHGRERCLSEDFRQSPAAMLAATHHLLDTKLGHNVQVLFPYSHKLRLMADWNVQLVAESLGKSRNGQGVGPTPHGALGATDQHSQVQLFAEGPHDKVFTFLRVLNHKDEVVIPAPPAGLEGLSYLGGKTFGQLLDAECRATQLALTEAGRPNCLITLPEVDARSVGELIMWLQIATAFGGELYGVDAFNQPGVEAGKVATYGLMGREGFEAEKARVEGKALSNPSWRIA
ncbi:MAG: glucose-6-phosphate isomerase [Planctomycetota bacterium]|nr:MAG: glucose-6-phosphate isomerase [Planctomycetota bacterium]